MIVDPERDTMTKKAALDSPPSYASAIQDLNNHASSSGSWPPLAPPAAPPQPYSTQPNAIAAPTVYNYVNPITKQSIATILPPDHPEMICLQTGQHITETKFGLLGVLAAIFWFPIGIGLCLLDRRVQCVRCGSELNHGLCS